MAGPAVSAACVPQGDDIPYGHDVAVCPLFLRAIIAIPNTRIIGRVAILPREAS